MANKTMYGILFKPGEIHDVPGYINHPRFIRIQDTTSIPVDTASSSNPTKVDNLIKSKDSAIDTKDSTTKKKDEPDSKNANK